MKKLHIVTLVMLGGFSFATIAGAQNFHKEKDGAHKGIEKKVEPKTNFISINKTEKKLNHAKGTEKKVEPKTNFISVNKTEKEKKGTHIKGSQRGSSSNGSSESSYDGLDTPKQPKKEKK